MMAKTATTIRNSNHATTQKVFTHECRSSKASDPRNKTQNTMPGIHLRFHFGHLMRLPQSLRPAFRCLLLGPPRLSGFAGAGLTLLWGEVFGASFPSALAHLSEVVP